MRQRILKHRALSNAECQRRFRQRHRLVPVEKLEACQCFRCSDLNTCSQMIVTAICTTLKRLGGKDAIPMEITTEIFKDEYRKLRHEWVIRNYNKECGRKLYFRHL